MLTCQLLHVIGRGGGRCLVSNPSVRSFLTWRQGNICISLISGSTLHRMFYKILFFIPKGQCFPLWTHFLSLMEQSPFRDLLFRTCSQSLTTILLGFRTSQVILWTRKLEVLATWLPSGSGCGTFALRSTPIMDLYWRRMGHNALLHKILMRRCFPHESFGLKGRLSKMNGGQVFSKCIGRVKCGLMFLFPTKRTFYTHCSIPSIPLRSGWASLFSLAFAPWSYCWCYDKLFHGHHGEYGTPTNAGWCGYPKPKWVRRLTASVLCPIR